MCIVRKKSKPCPHRPIGVIQESTSILHITSAKYVRDYKIEVIFNDGRKGEADLSPALKEGVFQSLQDIALFSQVAVEPELDTVSWPNGLDLAPEFVYFFAFKNDPSLQSQFRKWGYIS